MNGSGMEPTEYNVLVKPKKVEEKTAGGLYIPDTKKEKDEFGQTQGILVATSPLAFSYADWPEGSRTPQIGDQVLFSRYQATEFEGRDGDKYWFMKDASIVGVLHD